MGVKKNLNAQEDGKTRKSRDETKSQETKRKGPAKKVKVPKNVRDIPVRNKPSIIEVVRKKSSRDVLAHWTGKYSHLTDMQLLLYLGRFYKLDPRIDSENRQFYEAKLEWLVELEPEQGSDIPTKPPKWTSDTVSPKTISMWKDLYGQDADDVVILADKNTPSPIRKRKTGKSQTVLPPPSNRQPTPQVGPSIKNTDTSNNAKPPKILKINGVAIDRISAGRTESPFKQNSQDNIPHGLPTLKEDLVKSVDLVPRRKSVPQSLASPQSQMASSELQLDQPDVALKLVGAFLIAFVLAGAVASMFSLQE